MLFLCSQILYDKDAGKFLERLNALYRLGYQAAFVDLDSIESLKSFRQQYFPEGKSPKLNPPVDVKSLLAYKTPASPIILFPRITVRSTNPDRLKQQLQEVTQHKIIIAVESMNKEALEVAARDGRVDILVIPTVEHQKVLTKGILSLAQQNQTALEISLTPLIEADHYARTRILRALYRLFFMGKPLSHHYLIGSYTTNNWLLRGPREYEALLDIVFHVGEQFIKAMVRENAENLALRFIKRDQDFFVEPGVEIVDFKPADPAKSNNSNSSDEIKSQITPRSEPK